MSAVKLVEKIVTEVTEPDMNGQYHQHNVPKFSWACLGCGLVWPMKWHAEKCESRNHRATWIQRYPKGPIINGVPQYGYNEYERRAIKRIAV